MNGAMFLTRRKFSAAAAAAATTGGLLLMSGSAMAAPTVHHATGQLYLSPPQQVISYKQVGDLAFGVESGQLDFSGEIAADGTITVSALITPNNGEYYTAQWSASATVDGRTGTLKMTAVGTDNGEYKGDMVITGSGGLAGFSGVGSYSGEDASGLGTYSVTYTL
jgi:hypothetical protein